MSIKIKMGGKWVSLSTLQDKINFAEATIPADSEQWTLNAEGLYEHIIPIDGIISESSVIGFFAYAAEGLFKDLICDGNQATSGSITVIATSVPSSPVQVNFIHSPSGGETSICLLGSFMDEQVETLVGQAIKNLPIKISDDGYTDIFGQRRVIQIDNIRENNQITIKYLLEGNKEIEDKIILNEKDLPISGMANGTNFVINWHNFEGVDPNV